MKAYIVWMNTEYELAEEAAIAINGHTISALQDEKTGEEAVKAYLAIHGYSPDALDMLEEAAAYFADHNLSGRSANRAEGLYNCVVFVDGPVTAEQWVQFARSLDFHSNISVDMAQEVFTGILPGSSDICYRLLNDLLCNYACDEPDMDFILIPNRPDVAGFDDLSYLLRSVDWTADNFKQHLARLKQTDLLWLYKRNLTTINQWMAENQVDLLDMATVLYPDTEDPESMCASLVHQWAHSLMYRYTQQK